MHPNLRICFAAAATGALVSGAAVARTPDIGKAEVVVPDAKSTTAEQEEKTLQVGTDVFQDDVVQTGKIGAVMLQFTDKTTLKVFPNSSVKLDKYVYDADRTVVRVGLSLLAGAMRIASGGPHSADKYELRTPHATLGIRGTVIHLVADETTTVIEALHGTFHACGTITPTCYTVTAQDDLNALQLWSDGRIELGRAPRDLRVRSAYGSSDSPPGSPVESGPANAVGPTPRSGDRGGSADDRSFAAGLFHPEGFGLFSGSGSGSGSSSGGFAQCFVRGTKILTPEGERSIETLRVGGRVVTTGGPATIRWITEQTFRRQSGEAWPDAIRPVLIEPGAIASAAPCRPLILSPGHSLFIDGHLIPAMRLVNGRTIRRVDYSGTELTYYNVVLDHHAVIFANNLAVETWHAHEARDRAQWDNFAAYRERYPATCDQVLPRLAPFVTGRRELFEERVAAWVSLRRPPADAVTSVRRRLARRLVSGDRENARRNFA